MNDEVRVVIDRSVYWGWGDPAQARPLPDAAWRFLGSELGAERHHPPRAPMALAEMTLPPVRLTPESLAAFTAVVGAQHVHTDTAWRVEHAGGKKWPDIYRVRHGLVGHAPDAVVVPADARQVVQVLAACVTHEVACVPFGGGTSVVGGVEPDRGPFAAVISLDLRRLDQVERVDPISGTATLGAGLRGAEAERALHPYGLTTGHYPQSHQEATIGGYVATRSAGQASSGYGRLDENVLGLTLATPEGLLEVGGRSPATAAGPSLLELLVGSEGAYGVITSATLRLHPEPTAKEHACWSFPDLPTALRAFRALAQDVGEGLLPDVCRLSDSDETWMNLTLAGRIGAGLLRYAALRGQRRPCLAILVWEGTDDDLVRRRRHLSERAIARHGGLRLPGKVARAWEHGRFGGPYFRDELVGHAILADTLETATTWDNLERLYQGVQQAIRTTFADAGTPCLLQCHVSHVYATGASLYFTFLAREADDPLAQWSAVKAAACEAILAHGGTITHHHAVGTDHRPYLTTELGPLGVRVLAAVKRELDPHGILNPGKLIPDVESGGGVA